MSFVAVVVRERSLLVLTDVGGQGPRRSIGFGLSSAALRFDKLRIGGSLVLAAAGIAESAGVGEQIVNVVNLAEDRLESATGPATAAAEIAEYVLRPHAEVFRSTYRSLFGSPPSVDGEIPGITVVVVAGMDAGEPRAHAAWLPAESGESFTRPVVFPGELVAPMGFEHRHDLEAAALASSDDGALAIMLALHESFARSHDEIGPDWKCALITEDGIELRQGTVSPKPSIGRH